MIPQGWQIERKTGLFRAIHITAPNGYTAVVTTLSRNPENVLYMLVDALLKGTDKEIIESIAEKYANGVSVVDGRTLSQNHQRLTDAAGSKAKE